MMASIENALEIIERLEKRAMGNCRGSTISHYDLGVLTNFYMNCSDVDRRFIFDCISPKMGLVLIGYTGELSAKAIDEKDKVWLVSALMLHVIEGFRFDPRENLRRLAFIYHAACELDVKFNDLADLVIPFAESMAKEKILQFCDRDPLLNKLQVFGMQEVKVDGKTRFVSF